MTQVDSVPPSLASSRASHSGLEFARRLVVLVPELEWDYIPAVHRIWELANAQQAGVLLISLCRDPRQELSLRRALVTFCALVQDGRIPVETRVEIGTNWIEVVKRNYQTDDLIVCFAEQRTGFLQKPLSQILESNLNVPVYILAGLYPPKSKSHWLSQVSMWLGWIGIVIGFFILQVNIGHLPNDRVQNSLLVFSIIPEFWLIWVWNGLFK